MTFYQITAAIRSTEGEVILCGSTSFGYIIRAVIRGQTFRIIVATTERRFKTVPSEPSTRTHIVSDAPSLQAWLDSLAETRLPILADAGAIHT